MGSEQQQSLGRSLAQVFAKTARREAPEGLRGVLELDLGLIRPGATNPRKHFDDAHLQDLARSIAQHGVLQPIIVLRQESGYEILAGERRWRAARIAGHAKVPAIVHERVDAQTVAELRLIENLQREDLNPIEVAEAYRDLMEHHRLSQEQVADRVGKNRSSVANMLRLLGLPRPLRQVVAEGRLSMGHARALLGCPDPAEQAALAQRCLAEGLSVREIEGLVRAANLAAASPHPAPSPDPGPAPRQAAHLRELQGNLSRLFDADVQVRERGGKGALTIRFRSKGHFQSVIAALEQASLAAKQTARA